MQVLDDDAIAVVERLAQEIWTEHFVPMVGLPQVEYMLKEFQSAAAIKNYISRGYAYYLVDLDGRHVGYLGVLPKADKGELFLSKFYLLSSSRGLGVGREMLAFVKQMAQRRGFKRIALNTNKKNVDTIRFYEKAGFIKRCSDNIELGGGFLANDWLMEMAV